MTDTRIADIERAMLDLARTELDPSGHRWPRYGRWVGPPLGIENELTVWSVGPTEQGPDDDIPWISRYTVEFNITSARVCDGMVLIELVDGKQLVQPPREKQDEFATAIRADQVALHRLLYANRATLFASAFDGEFLEWPAITTAGIEQTGPSFLATVTARVRWKPDVCS